MDGMEAHASRTGRFFWFALVASLLLHLAVLFTGFSSSAALIKSGTVPGDPNTQTSQRLVATLARPALSVKPKPAPEPVVTPVPEPKRDKASAPTPRKPSGATRKSPPPEDLNIPAGIWAKRSWTDAERAEMDKFLGELNESGARPKPATGQELSKKALAMARQLGRSMDEDGIDAESKPATGDGKVIEPYSLAMYFDAFIRKLNRSAAFVKNEKRENGSRKALVEITLNADGSLKSYRVLRSGDQAAEIAYIKSVVERASPFSAFPPDIRRSVDALSISMCIRPADDGIGSGFSRSYGGQDCRD